MNRMLTPKNIQTTESRNGSLTRGWLIVNAGVILILWGISWLSWGIYSYFDPPAEFAPSDMMLPANLFGQSGILIGLLLLIYGTRNIKSPFGGSGIPTNKTEREMKDIRTRGWKMALVGTIITFWGVLFLVLAIYNLVILRGTPDANTDIAQHLLCLLPGLVFGVPLLMLGSRMFIFGEEV